MSAELDRGSETVARSLGRIAASAAAEKSISPVSNALGGRADRIRAMKPHSFSAAKFNIQEADHAG